MDDQQLKEITFNHYLLLRTPDITDHKAVALGYLYGSEKSHNTQAPILAIGSHKGEQGNSLVRLFISISSQPFYETDIKGTIAAIKIAPLLSNPNEVSEKRLYLTLFAAELFVGCDN